MKLGRCFILTTSPPVQAGGKPPGLLAFRCRKRLPCRGMRGRPAGKELDSETGLYYFGARYLDPKTGRWLSGDPAISEYVPAAPVSDEARKRNGSLPGMGGVFNIVNLHVYHYAGNNPVMYVDPTGRTIRVQEVKYRELIKYMINSVSADKFTFNDDGDLVRDGFKKNTFLGIGRSREFSNRLKEVIKPGVFIFIDVSDNIMGIREDESIAVASVEEGGGGRTTPFSDNAINVSITGRDSPREIQMKDGNGRKYNPIEILVHELVGHAIPLATGQHGNAVDNENKVRRQMPSWEERMPDESHTTSKNH